MMDLRTITSTSPLPEPVTSGYASRSRTQSRRGFWKSQSMTALNKCKRYIERLFRADHMDFEAASWQMINLFIAPRKVFKLVQYRKQIKDQFARDDPAFLVLLGVWFIISAAGLSLVLHLPFMSFIRFLLWAVFIDCLAVGLLVASIFWFISNKFFRKDQLQEDVEWGFAFDVHLNAFFPPLVILHVFQLFFFNLFIAPDYFMSRLFGNSFWLMASLYYVYITYLGYSSIVYLKNTKFILYSIIPLTLYFLITIIAGHNICRSIMDFYHYRVY